MLNKLIGTLFFIGYFPIAPGTVASAMAMVILGVFKPKDLTILLILLFSLLFGTLASERLEKKSGRKDPSYVVIDEFVGYLTTVLFIPHTWKNLLIGFFLFRFLDIVKPPPIRQIEKRLKGGLGIMMDDVVAGVIGNLLLRALLML